MQHYIDTYADLFINNTPLMDVRAPIEYERGSFPYAKNLPIMDNHQRETVGTCFKHHGQNEAIRKGHELVQGELREARIAAWVAFAKQNPNGSLYCFRGGLRSQIAQQWMHESGTDFPVVKGGYKALRTYLLEELEYSLDRYSFKLVGGKTGCRKTILINCLANGIDLEAAAYHRGSSFGRHARPQNSQINFENILAIDFIKHSTKGVRVLVLEDEARTIGRVGLPKTLLTKMRNSPLVVIEDCLESRLERLLQEYVVDMQTEYMQFNCDEDGFKSFTAYLLHSLDKIQKRLGPARYGDIRKSMQQALASQAKTGELNKHYDWLRAVLENYYDPMYEDQINQRKEFVCFRGNYAECLEFLAHSF